MCLPLKVWWWHCKDVRQSERCVTCTNIWTNCNWTQYLHVSPRKVPLSFTFCIFSSFFQKDWVRDRARKSKFTFEYRETGQLWVPLTQGQICPVFCLLVSLVIFLFIQQNGYHLESHRNSNEKSLSSSIWPTSFHVLRVFRLPVLPFE